MPGLNKKYMQQLQKQAYIQTCLTYLYNLSWLDVAEISLGAGALFGLLAVLALMLFSFSLALIATTMAIAALVVAIALFIIPPKLIIDKQNSHQTTVAAPGASIEVLTEKNHDFIPSTRQILESTGSLPIKLMHNKLTTDLIGNEKKKNNLNTLIIEQSYFTSPPLSMPQDCVHNKDEHRECPKPTILS